jgi:hypothetical protein
MLIVVLMTLSRYGKPGVDEDAHPVDQLLSPTLRGAYRSVDHDKLVLDVAFPEAACRQYGAPASALLTLSSPNYPQLELRLELRDKQPTRLPEATWLQFAPTLPGNKPPTLHVNKLGERGLPNWVSPLGVVDGGAKSLQGFAPDGPSVQARFSDDTLSSHGVASTPTLTLTSLDAGVARFDAPFPTPTPIFRQPDLAQGVHIALHMNTWNTN